MSAPSGAGQRYPYIVAPSTPVIAHWDAGNGGQMIATLPGAIYGRFLTGESVFCSVPASAALYWSYIDPSNLFDNTPNGTQNTADYPNPRYIPPNTPVVVVWTNSNGIAQGTNASVTFFTQQAS